MSILHAFWKELRVLRSVTLCSMVAVGCGSGSDVVQIDRLERPNLWAVGGGADLVAAQWYTYQGTATVDIFRQDASSPDRLLLVGSLPFTNGSSRVHDLAVTSDWLTVNWGGTVYLVSLAAAPALAGAVSAAVPATLDRTVAKGAFLLTSENPVLRLYSLANPASPSLVSSYTPAVSMHAVAAVPGGFLAFGDGVFVTVSVAVGSGPVWAERTEPKLPFSRKAVAVQGQIAVAGPGHVAGRSQIAKYDTTDLAAPRLVLSVDDLPVEYNEFSWDGGDTYVVAGIGSSSPGLNTSTLLVLREAQGNLSQVARSNVAPVYAAGDASLLHAWNRRLYVSAGALFGYRLP